MSDKAKNFHWKDQKKTKNCEMILCPLYDTYKDFDADPSGYYVLIKVDLEYYRLEVAVCNRRHEIEKIFVGQTCQSLYHSILKYEEAHNLDWFLEKKHIAYLGKELKKAEIALVTGQNGYFQE